MGKRLLLVLLTWHFLAIRSTSMTTARVGHVGYEVRQICNHTIVVWR
jgi:hypothetical protein